LPKTCELTVYGVNGCFHVVVFLGNYDVIYVIPIEAG